MDFKDFARHAIRSLLWRLHLTGERKDLYKPPGQNSEAWRAQKFKDGMGFRKFVLCRLGFTKAPAHRSEPRSIIQPYALHYEMTNNGAVDSARSPQSSRRRAATNDDEIPDTV